MRLKIFQILLAGAISMLLLNCQPEEPSGLSDSEIGFLLLSLPSYRSEVPECPGPNVDILVQGQSYTRTFTGMNAPYWFTFENAAEPIVYKIKFTEAPGQDIEIIHFSCRFGRQDQTRGDSGLSGATEEIEMSQLSDPYSPPRRLGIMRVKSGSLELTFDTE